MKNDLIATGIIFISICFGLQNLQHNQELNRLHKLIEAEKKEKIEAMKVAIDINNRLQIHIENNAYLNVEIDSLMNEINEFKDLKKLKKDLDRSR
jgi:hypothetical protein